MHRGGGRRRVETTTKNKSRTPSGLQLPPTRPCDEQMSTPAHSNKRPGTRSATKKSATPNDSSITNNNPTHSAGSPALRGRKRKNSGEIDCEGPLSKKMAEDKILDAIKAVNNTVNSMENKMKTFATKDDLCEMMGQVREVKNGVLQNSANIERLFELRKTDQEDLARQVEGLVKSKITTEIRNDKTTTNQANLNAEHELQYLRCRRSVRLWPISEVNCLEAAVRSFMKRYLKVPNQTADKVRFGSIERVESARRSKIHKEVVVRFLDSHTRDAIHSYAPNLADAGGTAGLRLEVPDFLRGLFRLFESHGAALRAKHGTVKRSIRFDDENMSLHMDVKLESTQWHRITGDQMRHLSAKKRSTQDGIPSDGDQDGERNKILMINEQESHQEDLFHDAGDGSGGESSTR